MTTLPPGPENGQEDEPDDSQDDDRPSGISHITTPAELAEAATVDWEQLFFGLENRTSCCLEAVPHDCLTSTCGHGDHEFRVPTEPGGAEPESWEQRDDVPCVLYAPEPALLYHQDCQKRRSRSQAIREADDLWEKETVRTKSEAAVAGRRLPVDDDRPEPDQPQATTVPQRQEVPRVPPVPGPRHNVLQPAPPPVRKPSPRLQTVRALRPPGRPHRQYLGPHVAPAPDPVPTGNPPGENPMTDAPTAVETRTAPHTAPKMLASAGGDHRAQLVHLKAHLAFQAQTKCEQARINWSTVITRAQSRRHITRALHEKINSKVPGFHPPGKVNTPDGQRRLESVVNHAKHGNFFGGDGNVVLPWRLQYRIYRSTYPRHSDDAFWDLVGERRPVPVRPKEETFALEIRVRLAEARALRNKLEELLRNQGRQPEEVAGRRAQDDAPLHHLPADLPGGRRPERPVPGLRQRAEQTPDRRVRLPPGGHTPSGPPGARPRELQNPAARAGRHRRRLGPHAVHRKTGRRVLSGHEK